MQVTVTFSVSPIMKGTKPERIAASVDIPICHLSHGRPVRYVKNTETREDSSAPARGFASKAFISIDPANAAGIIPIRYPPVGPSRDARPPPDVKTGRPAVPMKRYTITLDSARDGGRHAEPSIVKSVVRVIGTGTIGILMNAPAEIRAAKRAVSVIFLICFL